MVIPYYSCMVAAEAAYHLPVHALPAIQKVEGGWVGAVRPNSNGSHDLGLMQVNTLWVAPLAYASGLPASEVATRLILDPCFNITAAAYVLHHYVLEEHGDLWRAIGDYHSHSTWLSTTYKLKVLSEAMALPPIRAHHVKRKAAKAAAKPRSLAAN